MQSIQRNENKLIQGRKAALVGFFILLLGGTALIGFGTASKNYLMLVNGGAVLVSCPIFLTVAMILRRKIEKLGI